MKNATSTTRRILIINGKGGCGKTTIATNLAVAYAQAGIGTAVLDYDSQASSTDWGDMRIPTRAPIAVLPMYRRVHMYQTRAFRDRLPPSIKRIVIDTPSGARERDIDQLIRRADVIIIPVMPSALDVRAGARFIAELLTLRSYKANPRAIGVVVNRLQDQNATQAKLMHSLQCLGVPCVATFHDSALYSRAAEDGAGVVELQVEGTAARREQAQWYLLVDWIENLSRLQSRPPRAASPTLSSATGYLPVNS